MSLTLSFERILTLYLTAFLCGFALGMVYDLMKSFGELLRSVRAIDALLAFFRDILFFVLAAFVFSVVFFVYTYGRVRLFALFMGMLGFVFYRSSLSRLITRLMLIITGTLGKFIRLLTAPLEALVKAVKKKAENRKSRRIMDVIIKKAKNGYR